MLPSDSSENADSRRLSPSQLHQLPAEPGVYLFKNRRGSVIYVGKAVRLVDRVRSYFSSSAQKDPKGRAIKRELSSIEYILVRSEIEALLLETTLIARYKPRWNAIIRDEHSRVYLKITTKDPLPIVSVVRRQPEEEGVRLFGPFPSTTAVRTVLRRMRRIFPFYTRHHHATRQCLYCHLGQCPGPTRDVDHRAYRRTITNLTFFLSGRTKTVMRRIEAAMHRAAKREDYDTAAKLRQQLTAIAHVTQPIRHPELYIERPTLVEDEKMDALKDLQKLLSLRAIPRRIEGYDIAHFTGKQAVGSMVVLHSGTPETRAYRRFRIRGKETQNDYAMLQEVLLRRLRHDEWPRPHLFVIDGGKGQVAAAEAILRKEKVRRRVIGLAKREEVIIVGNEEIRLARNHPALKIIQLLRDEAHRFAQQYHKLLRKKKLLSEEETPSTKHQMTNKFQ